MQLKLATPVLALSLVLAACGASEDNADTPPQAAQTGIPVEPDGGIGNGAPPLAEAGGAQETAMIPRRFHGVWDFVEGSCDPASDLRAEITAERIVFYESVGEVQSATDTATGAEISLAMEGEGQTWESRFRMTLQQDPERLVLENVEFPDDPAKVRKRCAS